MYQARKNKVMDEQMADLLKEQILNELKAYQEMDDGRKRPYDFFRRNRRDREYQRLSRRLRGDLRREVGALRAVERRAGRPRDPLVREILQDLLEEAQARGMTMEDLARAYPSRPGFSLWSEHGNLISMLALVLALSLFVPGVRDNLRPLAKKVVAGTMNLTEQLNSLLATVREEVEDIVAEAQFSRLTESLNPDQTPKGT